MRSIFNQEILKTLALSEVQFKAISLLLNQAVIDTKNSHVLIGDVTGMMVTESGGIGRLQGTLLCAVASANYAASNQMAKLVGENGGFHQQLQRGDTLSILVAGIDEQYFIMIVFENQVKVNGVFTIAEKLCPKLKLIFNDPDAEPISIAEVALKVDAEFNKELSEKLDQIFLK